MLEQGEARTKAAVVIPIPLPDHTVKRGLSTWFFNLKAGTTNAPHIWTGFYYDTALLRSCRNLEKKKWLWFVAIGIYCIF